MISTANAVLIQPWLALLCSGEYRLPHQCDVSLKEGSGSCLYIRCHCTPMIVGVGVVFQNHLGVALQSASPYSRRNMLKACVFAVALWIVLCLAARSYGFWSWLPVFTLCSFARDS